MKHFKRKNNNIFSSQIGIATIFTILMLTPNIFLAYTEPYSFTTIVSLLLMPAGFYLLWSIALSRPGVMILLSLPFMILGAFQLVLLYLFGGSIIAVDMFTNLFTTNVSEASELLGNIYPAVVGVCILYIPVIALGIRSLLIKEHISSYMRRKIVLISCVMIVLGGVSTIYSKSINPGFGIKYHIFPVNVIYNIKMTLNKWQKSTDYYKTSKNFTFEATKVDSDTTESKREIYIMVIGEASRAANWELLGYDRETNPRLSKTPNVIAYSDVLTQANATHKSVPIMLAPSSAEDYDSIYMRKSVIELFNEAGFRTLFISNQVPNRSLIDYFAAEADQRIDISPRENNLYTESRYDGEMLPHIREAITASSDNLFIVLHTYGSHFNFAQRYPPQFANFTPDQAPSVSKKYQPIVLNSYDNSVLYTDFVMSEVINLLDSTQSCTAMFYCADHGEDLMDDKRGRFLHASPTPTYYQLHIACFGWFSEPYKHLFPNKFAAALNHRSAPITTLSLFHTMADIANIKSRNVDPKRSLVSEQLEKYPRKYLNDHDHAVDFYNTGLKSQDFEMLDRHLIKYDKQNIEKIRY